MTDEVKKLMEEATAVLEVPFEPPLGKGALIKVRGSVSARIKFYGEMTQRGLTIAGGVESAVALLRAIDNYLRVAKRPPQPDPSPEEWWASVLDQANERNE
jgi:hypothetical protein